MDIETSPNIVHAWGLYDQNIGINQIVSPSHTLCYAARWVGTKKMYFDSVHKSTPEEVAKSIWSLIDEADCVLHYNGTRFDIPTLNKDFLKFNLPPPSSYKQIDLLKTSRRQFKLPSNKLAYLSRELGLEGKVKHEGHDLWTKCMAGDDKAWKTMEKYNKQDVILLEQVYQKLKPWVVNHPNVNLYSDDDHEGCTKCSSKNLKFNGRGVAGTQVIQRIRCLECGNEMKTAIGVTKKPQTIRSVA